MKERRIINLNINKKLKQNIESINFKKELEKLKRKKAKLNPPGPFH